MLKIPICNTSSDGAMELDITSSTQMEGGDMMSRDEGNNNVSKTILKTPEKPGSPTVFNYRQNHVSNVVLGGIPIVSLHIDGKERLCLAQISNTLLKQFSYNEIHNRRVALGITCVQCTPVQLEILRRAGAMPISSRRCGMITKREAERLVKSFLEDNVPPKLPDNFYFDVKHACGWGCRGRFEPSRYNSSRAKCIKCNFCNMYFSPNKFIFHFHRSPDSKYSHPDAANFNSWRRHLTLWPGSDSEDVLNAWEDVKAMFNGGSRKRISSPHFSDSRPASLSSSEIKKPKLHTDSPMLSKPSYGLQYQNYPIFSMPGKAYPFTPLATSSHLGLQYPLGKPDLQEDKSRAMALPHWRNPNDFMIPSYDFLWSNQFGVRQNAVSGIRPDFYSVSSPVRDLSKTSNDRQSPSDTVNSSDDDENMSALNYPLDHAKSSNQRFSAFRPVLKPSSQDQSDSERDAESRLADNQTFRTPDATKELDNEDLDVEIDDEYGDGDTSVQDESKDESPMSGGSRLFSPDLTKDESSRTDGNRLYSPDTSGSSAEPATVEEQEACAEDKAIDMVTANNGTDTKDEKRQVNKEAEANIKYHEESHDINSNNEPAFDANDMANLTKDELQRLLQREINVRRAVERDVNKIKDDLNDQVNKEKSQRDEIAKQLQAMKDALCNELEQERKIRFSMQHKLKEAHDALHNFSCKMLASRQCAECAFKEAAAVIPR